MNKPTKISKPGQALRYEYKGVRIDTFGGGMYPQVWIFYLDGKRKFATTLEGAAFDIDNAKEARA